MRRKKIGRYVIEAVLLLAVGAGLAVLMRRQLGAASGWVLASDVLFAQASVFFAWGVWHLLGNMHMFSSAAWSFRTFHALIRGKQMSAAKDRDAFLAYRESRPHHGDVALCLIGAGLLLALSLACAVM